MAINKGNVAAKKTGGQPDTPSIKSADGLTLEESDIIPLTILKPETKILVSGDTGAGKTAQLGLLAELMYVLSGGKPTVLFTMDEGGFMTIDPLIECGVVKIVTYDDEIPPWIWIKHALKGEAKIEGQWHKLTDPAKCAMVGYEGLTAFAEFMLEDLSRHSAEHPNQSVGGDSAWTFSVSDGEEELKLASNTMSHYGLVQMRIMHEILKSKPGVPSIWTALLTRAADPMGGGVLGPMTVGKAQAPTISRLFDLTFRINASPNAQELVHELFLETHNDKQAKGSKVIANSRLPLSGAKGAPVMKRIVPASIVSALQQIQARHGSAVDETKARLARMMGKKA